MELLVIHTGFRVSCSMVKKVLLSLGVTVKRAEFRKIQRVPSDRLTFRRVLDGEADVRSLVP